MEGETRDDLYTPYVEKQGSAGMPTQPDHPLVKDDSSRSRKREKQGGEERKN